MMTLEKLDANEQIYFGQQLTKIKSTTYRVKFPELKARRLFPISLDGGKGTKIIGYEMYEEVGFAKVVSNYATDFPRVDIRGKEHFAKVRSLGDSYGYNIQEIREAEQAKKDLQGSRASSAKRAIYQLENKIAFFGDPSHNIVGFLTNVNISTATVENDGDGDATAWTTKTSDQIIRDISDCLEAPSSNTNDVESATNTLLLPSAQYKLIKNKRCSTNSDISIYKYIMNGYEEEGIKLSIIKVPQLASSKNDFFDSDIMVAYERNPDKVTMEVPVDFEQFPPTQEGQEYVIDCHERFGGILMPYPLSAANYDGI